MDRPGGSSGNIGHSIGKQNFENNTRTGSSTTTQRVRPAASNSSLSSQACISGSQFIALAREAMENALEENQTKSAEVKGVSTELKPGVTIDLSHKHIQRFPEEVVDIIKDEIERLALSHNQIFAFPSRFSECKSLRYLNVRNNIIREFPQPICDLVSLEILDFGRNKLKVLPPELIKLTSLKVLSVQKNRIETLPLCIADMASLQILKLDGNPIQFPPREVLQPQKISPLYALGQEKELDEPATTLHIKRFLKQKQISERCEIESGGEESSEGTGTSQMIKRAASGRFPIRVNNLDLPDLRSPAITRPPPIPSRSHYRGQSQQTTVMRRPGVMPLTIGNVNERVRSNSEGVSQPTREQSLSYRLRRMGILSKKSSDLDTVNETKPNRLSHYRGLSHGSAMGGSITSRVFNFRSPASPADSPIPRATYVRRLSSLPECKRESISLDPDVEAAKSILYALFQVHPLIQSLLGVARESTSKRTSLERVFYNATTHVEELDKTIQEFMTSPREEEEEGAPPLSSESVRHACVTCVNAYLHVLNLLQTNVNAMIENGDARYIRTLLLLIYGSTCEIYVANLSFTQRDQSEKTIPESLKATGQVDASINQLNKGSITPTRLRPITGSRARSATAAPGPSSLRAAHPPHFLNGAARSATFSSVTSRSGHSTRSSSRTLRTFDRIGDFSEEDGIFEEIFLRLQQSSELTMQAIPTVHNHFYVAMKTSCSQTNPEQPKQFWQALIQKCVIVAQNAEMLRSRLSQIKLKEPGIRSQGAFWELCYSFIQAFTDLVIKVKEAKSVTTLMNNDIIVLLRPLQKVIKDTSQLIQSSPWSFLASPASSSMNGLYSMQPNSLVSVPMTPLSVALGPAVQATVPSTAYNAPYNPVSSGNMNDRTDGSFYFNSSLASSRTATMTSVMGSMGTNDGTQTPASVMSSMNSFSTKYNSMNKVMYS
ncbi:hypothetical protein K3495_g214 [Podosphaera aphanis]|nr:hypothetical protein K3495_g214 [Podosphaera aphanis]